MRCFRLLGLLVLFCLPVVGRTQETVALPKVIEQVNQRVVKLFGSGGFQGIPAYGTGILVSPDGYILTVATPMLDTQDLRVHLYDGRRFHGRVIVTEPMLDAALVKIDKVEDLPFFDVVRAAEKKARAGDPILGFSNQYEIATRDEPVSVQQGVIAAYARLQGRRGIFEAPYKGEAYIVDAITNNPGAGGGALTTRKGELLGVIGKELKNTLSDTWVNYAVPVSALAEFVEKGRRGEYKPVVREKPLPGLRAYHGLILVPDVVERTPPFVEAVEPESPAARAGLKPDDLIVYIDGERVPSIKALREIIDRAAPGTQFRLEVRRNDRLATVELKVEAPRK